MEVMKNIITDKSHFSISNSKYRRRSKYFSVYDEFFKDEIVYKIYSDRIEFRKPTLNDRKNVLKPYKTKHGTGYDFTISEDLDINTGSYNFEEIEDNDVRIFYL